MLDMDALRRLVEEQHYAPLFVTVSGAHLYGFPSPDSNVDLRGAHLLPLRDVIGLDMPEQTVERKLDLAGVEVELVSHDLGKYLRLLVKNNGYVLEQIFSPLVVNGQDFLAEVREDSPGAYSGRCLLALQQVTLRDAESLDVARRLLRQALDHCLEGRELRTRTVARSMARRGNS